VNIARHTKLVLLVLAAAGIGALTAGDRFPMTLTDEAGNPVSLPETPERIVSLAPSHTEILFALGLGDRVVGVTDYCNYPEEAAGRPTVGGFADIDVETVVGLGPDLVLGTSMHASELAPRLQALGVTTFIVDPRTVADVLETILTVGIITGRTQQAALLVAQMTERIAAVAHAVEGEPEPKVFWELGPDLFTAGPGSFVDDLIRLAGGENVASNAQGLWPQLGVEMILLEDPDVIVLADHAYGETFEKVAARPGWGQIAAVVEGRVIELSDDDIFSRPGPRLVDALEFLAKALHPERLSE